MHRRTDETTVTAAGRRGSDRAIHALLATGEPHAGLSQFAREAADAIGAKDAAVLVRDGDDLLMLAGSKAAVYPTAMSLCRGAFAHAEHPLPSVAVIRSGLTVEVEDTDKWQGAPGFREACLTAGIRAVLAVPLDGPGGCEGSLNFGFATPKVFGSRERVLARELGALVAPAVEWAKGAERKRTAERKMKELDELHSDFLSTVSHELRTPLTGIRGFSATLSDRWPALDDEMRLRLVRRIGAEAVRLERVMTNLLDLARLERGAMKVRLQPVDVGIEVRRAAAALHDALASHRLVIDAPGGLSARADPVALGRILCNLLENAAKFSPAGSRIWVKAAAGQHEVMLSVRDEGGGIGPEELERIFDRFYRGRRGDASGVRGTGIGLALVKEFVEAQGGTVSVASAPGRGAEVRFTLQTVNGVRPPRPRSR